MTAAATAPTGRRGRRDRPSLEEGCNLLRDTLHRTQLDHPPAGQARQPITHGLGLAPDEERDTLAARELMAAILHRTVLDYLLGYTYSGKTKVEQHLAIAEEAEDWLWMRGDYRGAEGVTSAQAICDLLRVDLGWVQRWCVAKLASLRSGEPIREAVLRVAMGTRRRYKHRHGEAAASQLGPGRMAAARRHNRS